MVSKGFKKILFIIGMSTFSQIQIKQILLDQKLTIIFVYPMLLSFVYIFLDNFFDVFQQNKWFVFVVVPEIICQ